MKKLLVTITLLLSSFLGMATDVPTIFSSCIKMNPDGTETLTASMKGLSWTPGYPAMVLWINTSTTPGSTLATDWIELSCSTPSPIYTSGGSGSYQEGTFTYTIPVSLSIPLNRCYEVVLTDPEPWLHPRNPLTEVFHICPCMTDACYYKDPGTGHETLTFYSPAADPVPLYVYLDNGSGPQGDFDIMTPGVPHGLQYAHSLDLTTIGTHFRHDACFTAWVSDIAGDKFEHTPHVPYFDPNNGDNWAYSFQACECAESYYGGCISMDERGNQTVTVHTNSGAGIIYMWSAGYGPVASSSVVGDGAGGNLVTFDLAAYGIGISMECHTFYFNTSPTNPAPTNAVIICPCGENGQDPTPEVVFQNACMSLDMFGNETISIETNNNSSPNYAWYGTMGPIHQTGIGPNPAYIPGSGSSALPYIATFNLSAFGAGIALPFGPCYTFFFSGTTTSPDPMGAFVVCPCPEGLGGKPGTSATAVKPVPVTIAKVQITPNPNTGTFKLSGHLQDLMSLKEVTIEVNDMLGKTLLTETVPVKNGSIEENIAMREVANGVYMVKITGDHVNQVLRFVVDK